MKVSVCMATYNGARYLQEQIDSILPQLDDGDELIIVDDASQDETLSVISSFRDSRIKLLHNPSNLGVIRSFERAISAADGDLIFLSDQDDLWRADKVEQFKRFFSAAGPEVRVALSDARVIDQNGREIAPSWMETRPFHPGLIRNVLKNSYLGCTMAFRRSALRYCLPFPARTPMHDMWIGLSNRIFGKTGFIDEALVSYRRHEANATGVEGSRLLQLIWRRDLIIALLLRAIQVRMRVSSHSETT